MLDRYSPSVPRIHQELPGDVGVKSADVIAITPAKAWFPLLVQVQTSPPRSLREMCPVVAGFNAATNLREHNCGLAMLSPKAVKGLSESTSSEVEYRKLSVPCDRL